MTTALKNAFSYPITNFRVAQIFRFDIHFCFCHAGKTCSTFPAGFFSMDRCDYQIIFYCMNQTSHTSTAFLSSNLRVTSLVYIPYFIIHQNCRKRKMFFYKFLTNVRFFFFHRANRENFYKEPPKEPQKAAPKNQNSGQKPPEKAAPEPDAVPPACPQPSAR